MRTLPNVAALPAHAHDLLRRHAGFVVLLAGGGVLRILAMLGFPPVLWFTGDSYFYLTHTLRLSPAPSKTMGYPFLLKLLLPFHSLTLVAAVQHLMGLATAVMIYALLRRFRLPRWGSALATVPVLYDAYQIELEQMLMAETLFTFLIVSAVTLMLWAERRPAWMALAAGLLLGWAVLVRSAGAAALPVFLVCLVVRRVGWRACAAATAGCVVPLAGYAMWFHAAHGTYGLTSADGLYLWGRTSSFATCAKLDLPPEERGLCLSSPLRQRPAPGTLVWRSTIPPRLLPGGPVTDANNRLLRSFAIHAIESQPGDYLSALAKGAWMAVSPHRYHYPNRDTEALYHFPGQPHQFPTDRLLAGLHPAAAARTYGHQAPSQVVEPYAGFLRGYQSWVFLPGPVIGLLFAAGAAGLLRHRRGATLMAWSIAVALLLFPLALADFDYRYVLPAVPFACLAAGLALASREAPEQDVAPPERGHVVRRRISRWWGTRGSLRRDSDRASVP